MDLLSTPPEQVTVPKIDYSEWTHHYSWMCLLHVQEGPVLKWSPLLLTDAVPALALSCEFSRGCFFLQVPLESVVLDLSFSQVCMATANSCCVKWRQCLSLVCPKRADSLIPLYVGIITQEQLRHLSAPWFTGTQWWDSNPYPACGMSLFQGCKAVALYLKCGEISSWSNC